MSSKVELIRAMCPSSKPVKTMMTIDELSEKVTVQENGCWVIGKGRGRPSTYYNGKPIALSRAVMMMYHGVASVEGKEVLHSCDNPRCVNPAHLRIGTPKENSLDAVERKRISHQKMTYTTAREARMLRALGGSYGEIATRYGVKESVIADICNNRSFVDTKKEVIRSSNNRTTKLSKEDVEFIKKAHGNGVSVKKLHCLFGVSAQHISNILNGKRW